MDSKFLLPVYRETNLASGILGGVAHYFKTFISEDWNGPLSFTGSCAIRTILDDKNTPCDISLGDLLRKAGISLDAYVQGLKICSKGNSIVMKRSPSECWINNYNRDVLRAWKGNMDIQFILDPYACVMYITSYVLKSEKRMSELLRQVSRECRGEDIKVQLR